MHRFALPSTPRLVALLALACLLSFLGCSGEEGVTSAPEHATAPGMADPPRLTAARAVGPGFIDYQLGGTVIRIPATDPNEPGQAPRILDFGQGFSGVWDPARRVYVIKAAGITADSQVMRLLLDPGKFAGIDAFTAQFDLSPILPALGWIQAINIYYPTLITGPGIATVNAYLGIAGDDDYIAQSNLTTNPMGHPGTLSRQANWQLHADTDTTITCTVTSTGSWLSAINQGEARIEILYNAPIPIDWAP